MTNRTSTERYTKTAVTVLILALLTVACGQSSDSGATEGSTALAISGSSTVEPITALVAERFSTANPNLAITVNGPGTGDGFKLFCSGQTHVSNASRPIKDAEAEDCAAAGIKYVELQVAIDGLSVITAVGNDAIGCLNFADLYALTGPESIGFERWEDASQLATELGGLGGYPDGPLVITAPGEESGTYDTFVEFVIEGFAEDRGQEPAARPDYVASPNDNVIVEGVGATPTSLGWVGYAFYEENASRLKAIEVDGGEGCVAPTAETIANGSYPLSRPLFIYVSTTKAAEAAELEAFVDFYLSDEGLLAVSDAGYVALPAYDEIRAAWNER